MVFTADQRKRVRKSFVEAKVTHPPPGGWLTFFSLVFNAVALVLLAAALGEPFWVRRTVPNIGAADSLGRPYGSQLKDMVEGQGLVSRCVLDYEVLECSLYDEKDENGKTLFDLICSGCPAGQVYDGSVKTTACLCSDPLCDCRCKDHSDFCNARKSTYGLIVTSIVILSITLIVGMFEMQETSMVKKAGLIAGVGELLAALFTMVAMSIFVQWYRTENDRFKDERNADLGYTPISRKHGDWEVGNGVSYTVISWLWSLISGVLALVNLTYFKDKKLF